MAAYGAPGLDLTVHGCIWYPKAGFDHPLLHIVFQGWICQSMAGFGAPYMDLYGIYILWWARVGSQHIMLGVLGWGSGPKAYK